MNKNSRGRRGEPVIKIAGLCFIVLAAVEICIIFIFIILRFGGKSNIYKVSACNAPIIPKTEIQKNKIDEKMDENANRDWQEDWIRYQNKIYSYNDNIITFLIMGIDKQGIVKKSDHYQKGGQADALFLAACNPDNGKISIIAINRNTMVPIDIYDEEGIYLNTKMAQIALAHGYGDGGVLSCERTVNAVSNLFYQLPIHGYCSVNMGAIPIINDDIGGVEVKVLEDLTEHDKRLIKGNDVLLQGDMSYIYLRERKLEEYNSAGRRLERQKQYFSAFTSQLLSTIKNSPMKIFTIYNDAEPYLVTDLNIEKISYLASLASSFNFKDYRIYSLDGETMMGEKFEEYYVNDKALYELIINIFYKEIKNPEFGY